MNVLLILIDSLNRSSLAAYGGPDGLTPNLDRLARRAWRFEGHHVGSLPCMPARRELFSGRQELLWRPWGPLEPWDQRLPRLMAAAGYATGLVTDHYHYWEDTAGGYLQSFESTELVRGHELDTWAPPLADDAALPRWVRNVERWRPGAGRRYWANVRDFGDERDFFPSRVFRGAAEWLERRPADRPFFLQVESFDVHEPFHVPEPYASMFGLPPDAVEHTLWPPYQDASAMCAWMAAAPAEAIAFVREQYAAKLHMVDRWLGTLLDALDAHRLWEDTAVILTTDHGHDLGWRGRFGKQFPHHDTHAHIPLLVHHPQLPGAGRVVESLTTTVDLFATIAELGGADVDPVDSRSLVGLLRGGPAPRSALLYGTFGQGICATDGRWTIMLPVDKRLPLYGHSSALAPSAMTDEVAAPVEQGWFVPGATLPQWRYPVRITKADPHGDRPLLYDRHEDPGQERDRWADAPRERERMRRLVVELVDALGAPEDAWSTNGLHDLRKGVGA